MTPPRDPVARAIDVLAWIAEHPAEPLSVRQIARDIGTSPATVYRTLQAFQDRALIARDGGGDYTTGLELHRICAAIARELSPARIARPHLEALARESGETTVFAVYDGVRREMMFIEQVDAPHPLRYVIALNRWVPVHAGASGLAILAFLPIEERRLIYADGLEALTADTLVAAADLEASLEVVRDQGYAQSFGQRLLGAVGTAAPVFDADGRVCGDVNITIPLPRFEALEDRDRLPARLMATAAAVSAELKAIGYRGARAADAGQGVAGA